MSPCGSSTHRDCCWADGELGAGLNFGADSSFCVETLLGMSQEAANEEILSEVPRLGHRSQNGLDREEP